MKRPYLFCMVIILFCSCASLTKTQLTAVNQFAKTSEHFSSYPGTILEQISAIRLRSNIYAANSVLDVREHLKQLDSAYEFEKNNVLITAKADITFQIIDKYAQSLLLLSSDKYATNLATQAQAFGKNIDSLIFIYNAMGESQKIPYGLGGGINQLITAGGRTYIRSRQAREVKKFVILADTMISVMATNLVQFLESATIDELIATESRKLGRNYVNFLGSKNVFTQTLGTADVSRTVTGTSSTILNDEDYLKMKASLDGVKELRDKTVIATKKLRKAHLKLKEAVTVKKKLSTAIDEVQDLYSEIRKIKSIIALFEKSKQ